MRIQPGVKNAAFPGSQWNAYKSKKKSHYYYYHRFVKVNFDFELVAALICAISLCAIFKIVF